MNNKLHLYFDRVKYSLTNLLLDILSREKRMTDTEWVYYIGISLDYKLLSLYEEVGVIKEASVNIGVSVLYLLGILSKELAMRSNNKILSNKEYNTLLKEIGDEYVNKEFTKEYNRIE